MLHGTGAVRSRRCSQLLLRPVGSRTWWACLVALVVPCYDAQRVRAWPGPCLVRAVHWAPTVRVGQPARAGGSSHNWRPPAASTGFGARHELRVPELAVGAAGQGPAASYRLVRVAPATLRFFLACHVPDASCEPCCVPSQGQATRASLLEHSATATTAATSPSAAVCCLLGTPRWVRCAAGSCATPALSPWRTCAFGWLHCTTGTCLAAHVAVMACPHGDQRRRGRRRTTAATHPLRSMPAYAWIRCA